MTITLNGTTGIVNTGSETITGALTAANFNGASTFGFKNRIINGAMVIDQRNAGASVTITNTAAVTYTLDRWNAYGGQASKFSVQQNAGAVTPPTGFIKYLGVTSLSAYSVGASDIFNVAQIIEGFNVADLGWGAAGASTVTLSFWVRSSLTGTFGGVVGNGLGSRSYPFTYTISSANTWEQKSITIAGDTSGTWNKDNSAGMAIYFSVGTGTTFSGTAGAWAGANYQSATGATSVVGTNGATFYITGVQLETGTVATTFEYRPYGTELALCQRYFYKTNSVDTLRLGGLWGSVYASGSANVSGTFAVPMRVAPTTQDRSGTNDNWYMSGVTSGSAGTFSSPTVSTTMMNTEVTGLSASSVGQPVQYNGRLSFGAEL
jgi:hypothetical protein